MDNISVEELVKRGIGHLTLNGSEASARNLALMAIAVAINNLAKAHKES